jgi:hypothetical protein
MHNFRQKRWRKRLFFERKANISDINIQEQCVEVDIVLKQRKVKWGLTMEVSKLGMN